MASEGEAETAGRLPQQAAETCLAIAIGDLSVNSRTFASSVLPSSYSMDFPIRFSCTYDSKSKSFLSEVGAENYTNGPKDSGGKHGGQYGRGDISGKGPGNWGKGSSSWGGYPVLLSWSKGNAAEGQTQAPS